MAEEKEKKQEKSKKTPIKRPAIKKKKEVDKVPGAQPKAAPSGDTLAAKQRRSLIMFITAAVLSAVIFIPGDMVWLWLHNAVRGTCSVLSMYWPLLLVFLCIATMLDRAIPKLAFRTSFATGFVVALNACIYIFGYKDTFDIKQAFKNGVVYKGGGALGFIFGAPFIKLFGVIPARILIILVLMTLAVFALGIPVKKIYTAAFTFLSGKAAELIKAFKAKLAERHPVKFTDDKYFDTEGYDDFEIGSELDDDDDEFTDDNITDSDPDNDSEDKMPQSPVLSEELFNDDDDYFPEEPEEDSMTDEEAYSIDINIDEPAEPLTEVSQRNADDDDDAIFADIFGEDFLDTVEQGYRPEAAKAAKEITLSKNEPESIARTQPQPKAAAPKAEKKRSKKAYTYPVPELLTEGKSTKVNYERELRENAQKLIDTLESFSVGAKIVGYCRGPSVTRYEIQPAPGVKISKITGLSDDIALNLAAEGGVRMEAPIPGKPAIGVEIPNKNVTSVTMRELLESAEFNKNKKNRKLECVIGKDVAGKIVMMDLAKMPHLLIAGTTGSGKSVCVNSILMSILFRATPDEVKLILIDPKLVEFSKYKGIPHLLVPVVSDVKKAAGALGWAVAEMEDRYKELSLYNVKDIDSYNKMVEKNLSTMTPEELEEESVGDSEVVNGEFIPPKARKKMPKIVIAIDELADLMMAAPGEVEDYICRLAQKARAAGMHLVIATQRPSVNVITGVIKANIPSRISLKVASYVDSKTILDTGGGEKLIGKGDMLYMPVGVPKPVRVQGGFSSDEDIEAVTDFIKNHTQSDYDEDISEEIDRISESVGVKGAPKETDPDDIDDSDPMLEDAIKAVVELGQASTSLLQRKLRVGYARAGRLIDTMEQMGIVGPHEGSKSRKVLITQQEYIERKISGTAEPQAV